MGARARVAADRLTDGGGKRRPGQGWALCRPRQAGYKIPPHTHPTAENVTVLSGSFNIAMGDKFDPKKGEAVRAGGFFTAEKDMQHYGWTTRPAVIQIHGMGPFAINYVNPNDDPRNAKPTAKKQ